MLGYRYLEGNGIAKDNAEAYFWLSIAVACRTTPPGVTEWVAKPLAEFLNALPKSRDQARRRLSRQQVREVDERLRKWRPTPEPDFGTALETAAERAQAKAAGPLCEPVVR
jgi:hypothetical protein